MHNSGVSRRGIERARVQLFEAGEIKCLRLPCGGGRASADTRKDPRWKTPTPFASEIIATIGRGCRRISPAVAGSA